MTSVNKSMNMSATARRSVEHTQTGKGKGRGNDSGDESDGSDSSVAKVLDEDGVRAAAFVGNRIRHGEGDE